MVIKIALRRNFTWPEERLDFSEVVDVHTADQWLVCLLVIGYDMMILNVQSWN